MDFGDSGVGFFLTPVNEILKDDKDGTAADAAEALTGRQSNRLSPPRLRLVIVAIHVDSHV